MTGKWFQWTRRIVGVLVLLLAALISGGRLLAERPEAVLNPRTLSGSYVQDGGGVLGPEYVRLIDAVCRELKQKTSVELAVVTIGDLGGTTIDDFTERLFRRFGIGAAGKDNGILLLCSRDDRMVRIEVGYGLEGTIPDAEASRLLDLHAVPYFRQGLFGRGLFIAVREIARRTAAASGMVMTVLDPAMWPEQVVPPAPIARPVPEKKRIWDPLIASLILAAGLLGLATMGMGIVLLRLKGARARAQREKIIGQAKGFTILAWVAAIIGFFLIFGLGGKFLPPLVAGIGAPAVATLVQVLAGRGWKRRLAGYRLACKSCGQPMDLVPEEADDHMLDAAEAAEEKAGGMDYEFWKCPKCGAEEKLAVKLTRAEVCPKCRRRTLTYSRSVLAAATTASGGKERITRFCLNPDCGYSKTEEKSTPRLSSGSGPATGGSRSPSGSFGGGRSGGGGASKRW
jgi:uncharacterized protein